jgi:tetratricopeptide (TPR) repeat protein
VSTDGPDELLRHLCNDLRLLWTQAGGPSLRVLSAQVGLGKSQLGAILNGTIRRPPDWDVVRRLVESFHAYARAHDRMGRVSLRTGVEESWRPRYALLEYAYRHPPQAKAPASPPAAGPGREPAGVGPVPRQLPAGVRRLAGRAAELAVLDRLAEAGAGGSATVVTIDGTAGIGKTALAVSWAHRAADRFPDGQLYVNLGGFDPAGLVVSTEEATRGFLTALGVEPKRIPDTLPAQVALYRSVLAGRRVLVVLDNARDAGQVRPLLPGGSGCVAVVTSRNRLTGLVVAEGAHPLGLELLDPGEAWELLALRLGTARVAAEPEAVEEIVARCARLPLALAIVAAGAASQPALPLASFAAQLRTPSGSLDGLSEVAGGVDVRTAFSWSYRALSRPAARLFRLLGLSPGADIAVPAAASLAGLPVEKVRPVLAELVGAHLLAEHRHGRYVLHDLLRAYAMELAHAHEPDSGRRAALGRLLDHLLHTARATVLVLDPNRHPITCPPAREGVTVAAFGDSKAALDWCASEQPTLLAAIRRAAEAGFDAHAWQLTWASEPMLHRQVRRHEWAAVQEVALAAARRLGDPLAQAYAHRGLARAHTGMDSHAQAHDHYDSALKLFAAAGEPAEQAHTYLNLSLVCERQGLGREALEHTKRALDLFRRAGHRLGQARALGGLGWQHALLGEYEKAIASCERALALMEEGGDVVGQAQTWDSMGFAQHHLGQHEQAIACYRQALDLIRRHGDRSNEAEMLVHLGDTYAATGDPDEARAVWRQALDLLDALDQDSAVVRDRIDGVSARP